MVGCLSNWGKFFSIVTSRLDGINYAPRLLQAQAEQ